MTPSQGNDARVVRRASIWLFVVLAVCYLAGTRGHFVGSDELNLYQTTRSLYENGDFAVGFTRNVAMGSDGRYYSLYNAGLAFLALPFYALAGPFEALLHGLGLSDWVRSFSGPPLGSEPMRFGGDIEIWFVNLTNVVLTALIGVVFFRIQLLLGVGARGAALVALALGLATYVGPFSSGFLRHPAEALFILAAFYFLLRARREPASGLRFVWWAGVMSAFLVQARIAGALALPGLLGFYAYDRWQKLAPASNGADRLRTLCAAAVPVAVPLVLSALVHGAVNHIKFGSVIGYYAHGIESRFGTPLLYGLHAFLLSPGASLFVFSPLLLLLPWLAREALAEIRAEWAAVTTIALSYLLFYARFDDWHGLPSAIGPRYLMALTPLLLLPLGRWLERTGRVGVCAFGALVVAGLVVQFLHVAVSFGYVYHHENYAAYQPPFGFIFDLADSPLVAHFRALGSTPELVDSWLVSVDRQDGAGRVVAIVTVLCGALAVASWRLWRALGALEQPTGRRHAVSHDSGAEREGRGARGRAERPAPRNGHGV